MRPDRVALVLGEVLLRRALAGEDVEVIEPEVGHHLFELALAVGRAENLLLRELRRAPRATCARASICSGVRAGLPSAGASGFCAIAGIAGRRPACACCRTCERGHEVVLGQLARAHRQRLESRQAGRHRPCPRCARGAAADRCMPPGRSAGPARRRRDARRSRSGSGRAGWSCRRAWPGRPSRSCPRSGRPRPGERSRCVKTTSCPV